MYLYCVLICIQQHKFISYFSGLVAKSRLGMRVVSNVSKVQAGVDADIRYGSLLKIDVSRPLWRLDTGIQNGNGHHIVGNGSFTIYKSTWLTTHINGQKYQVNFPCLVMPIIYQLRFYVRISMFCR